MIRINREATVKAEYQAFVNALWNMGFTIDAYISTLERLVEAGYVQKQVEATGITYTLTELGVDVLKERLPEEWDRKMEEVISETLKQELDRIRALRVLAQYGGMIIEMGGEKVRRILENVPLRASADPLFEAARVALNILGEPYEPSYILGVSGAVFRTWIHEKLCPSSWDSCAGNTYHLENPEMALKTFGYKFHRISRDASDIEGIQETLQKVKETIDAGRPVICFNPIGNMGWGVIVGYDEEQGMYYMRTPDDERVEPSSSPIDEFSRRWLSVYFIGEKTKPLDAREAEMKSLRRAIQHAKGQAIGDYNRKEEYKPGFLGYETWIRFLESDEMERNPPSHWGNYYSLYVLRHARPLAAEYLKTLGKKYDPETAKHLKEAAECYSEESALFAELSQFFPKGRERETLKNPENRSKAADLLKQALKLEKAAIAELEKALQSITPK